jgi:predicted adenylyl cyclase CyaB
LKLPQNRQEERLSKDSETGEAAQIRVRRNLELKARHPNLAAARELVQELGAAPAGVEFQTDTYFFARQGRLKLREIQRQSATLIWYERADQATPRICHYQLVPVLDPGILKAALAAALGVRGEVCKRREIFLWHNVRIHLDEVAGLGTFVEFEAVLSPADDLATAQDRLNHLRDLLGISPGDVIPQSNADLLGL